jgi:hypothetical protein
VMAEPGADSTYSVPPMNCSKRARMSWSSRSRMATSPTCLAAR